MSFFKALFGKRQDPSPEEPSEGQELPPTMQMYLNLRGRALTLEPKDLGMTDRTGHALAFLMETGMTGGASATLVAVADGSTSLYLSNGGGIIGGGQHEAVREESRKLLDQAAGFADRMQIITDEYPLPGNGRVRFYLVRDDGVLTEEASEDELGEGDHPLWELFFSGHRVLTKVSEHAPGAQAA